MQKQTLQHYGPLQIDPKAYRFFPSKKQQKTEFTKKGTRFIYYGQVEHDQYEVKKLKEFHQWVDKNKAQYDKNFWNDQNILLFLQGHSYKPKQTIESMAHNMQLRKQYIPQNYETNKTLINKGFFYPVGRDKYFRPIMVFNSKLIDWKDVESAVRATCFLQQMIIETMFLPGQIETWVVIYDLGGMGLTQMPINALKTVSAKMGVIFSGRLGKLFIVNAPSSVYYGYKTVSSFLDPVTVEKIKLSKGNTQKTMFQIADKSQIQVKYGGTQPNRTQFWPFRIPAGVYDEKRLISDKQYEHMLKDGKLKNNQIDPKYKNKK